MQKRCCCAALDVVAVADGCCHCCDNCWLCCSIFCFEMMMAKRCLEPEKNIQNLNFCKGKHENIKYLKITLQP
jgi:hypothetical protein